MTRPEKISVSLYSESEVVLDLWKGFSGRPGITLRNDEEDEVSYCFPFSAIPKFTCCFHDEEDLRIDFGRAVRLGVLEITNLSANRGRTIIMDYDWDSESRLLSKRNSFASAHGEDHVLFGQVGSKLLEKLRCHLTPGSLYSISFTGQNLEMMCEFGDRSILHGAHVKCPSWDLQDIRFRIVAGVPVPRFSISVSAVLSSRSNGNAPHMHIIVAVTSLKQKSVTVNLMSDECWER